MSRSTVLTLSLVAAVCLAAVPAADAQLLNVPINQPIITFNNTGTLTYNATTQQLKIDATALAFLNGGAVSLITPFGTGTVDLVVTVDNTGALVGGTDTDLVVTGSIDTDGDAIPEYTGVLLTGKAVAFGYSDTGTPTDRYDFLVDVTGGALAGVMPGQVGIDVISENSNFAGSFQSNFNGRSKGNIGAVFGEGCGKTPGYWKNHLCDWPVDSLVIGGVEYNKQELINLLNTKTPDGQKAADDMSVKLAKFIVAAKLSILAGADPLEIVPTVIDGDAFLASFGIGNNPQGEDYELSLALKDLIDEWLNLPCDGDDEQSGDGDLGDTEPNSLGDGWDYGKDDDWKSSKKSDSKKDSYQKSFSNFGKLFRAYGYGR